MFLLASREEKHMTRAELARILNITEHVLKRWETGEHDISAHNLSRWCRALEVQLTLHVAA